MKKLTICAAVAVLATTMHAATVGWSMAGASAYANSTYNFLVIGQNNVASIAAITAILDAGKSIDAYAFGSGTIAANGFGTMNAAASGKTLDSGEYTAFFVLFDSDSPVAGESKYVVISGASTLTKTIADTTASVTFAAGNVASIVGDSSNWKSYGTGAIPEPTSGLLLTLGVAALALRRKRA